MTNLVVDTPPPPRQSGHPASASKCGCTAAFELQLDVGCDDRASLDLAVVKEVVGLGCAVEREVLDEHLDFSRLREADDFDQFGDGAPER